VTDSTKIWRKFRVSGHTTPAAYAQAINRNEEIIDLLAVIVFIGLIIYMIPTIIAFVRRHPNRGLIAVINIVFGGTGLGWLGSLVWAFSAVHRSPTGSHGGESGLHLFVNDQQTMKIVPALPSSPTPVVEDIYGQLLRLKGLHEAGAITAEEHAELKRPLLLLLQG